jgi:hypothetical protein
MNGVRRLLLVLALVVAGCSGGDDNDGAQACAGRLKTADPAVQLPARLPTGVTSPVLYDTQQLGATSLWFGQATGTDVVTVRDAVLATYERAGFTIESRDEEPPAEAEFQFTSAKDEGSVQVTPLCDGHVTIRWRLGPR